LLAEAGDGILREVDGEPAVVFRQQPYLLAPQHFSQKYDGTFESRLQNYYRSMEELSVCHRISFVPVRDALPLCS
jgi:hypothetical protein